MPTLRNLTTGKIVARDVARAEGFVVRILGLIPWVRINPEQGLWFDRCMAVHTLGMRDRIDVIFLDKSHRVLRVARSVPQHRLAIACPGASAVVELGEASAQGRDLLAGDELVLEER
jgi:uncharacterized membrane protein (UPF0127 family)